MSRRKVQMNIKSEEQINQFMYFSATIHSKGHGAEVNKRLVKKSPDKQKSHCIKPFINLLLFGCELWVWIQRLMKKVIGDELYMVPVTDKMKKAIVKW